jgi:hypothetical protein
VRGNPPPLSPRRPTDYCPQIFPPWFRGRGAALSGGLLRRIRAGSPRRRRSDLGRRRSRFGVSARLGGIARIRPARLSALTDSSFAYGAVQGHMLGVCAVGWQWRCCFAGGSGVRALCVRSAVSIVSMKECPAAAVVGNLVLCFVMPLLLPVAMAACCSQKCCASIM